MNKLYTSSIIKEQLDQTVITLVYSIKLLCCADALWVYSYGLYFFFPP